MKPIRTILLILFYLLIVSAAFSIFAQQQQKFEPSDIKFTYWMSRAAKDMQWSKTYYESYTTTHEKRYLKLAAQYCTKAIDILYSLQSKLSRTTKFFSQADQNRLQACKFYDKIQKTSLILEPKYHLVESGSSCKLF